VILGMMWGAFVSIYWRKLGAFWWLDHRGRGCELVALLPDRTSRQRKIEFIWTVGDENERILLESWCVAEWGVQASFYRPREGERGHE
jgi:hypothetical protein